MLDYGKVIVSVVAIGSLTFLTAQQAVSGEIGVGAIGVIAGYVLGNGKALVGGKISMPMIAPRAPDREDVVLTPEGAYQLVAVPKHMAQAPPVDPGVTNGFRTPGRHRPGQPPAIGGELPADDEFWGKS